MHGYYQKNLKKWHKTLNSYMNYISYELESLTGQSYDTLIQEIWTNYQAEMLERFPYIGGDAASGTKNLIGAYMFVSMGEVLKKYGAKVTLADHRIGNDCHIKKARELLKDNPDWICLNQFENPSNPKAHYLYTANEIIEQLNTPIDCFVSVIGSGGTITGISKRLKEYNPEIKIIGVEPKGCNILNNIYIPHKIQATAVGKVGNFFDKSMINEMVSVDFEEVQKIRNYLSFNQGIFVGISSGANVLAAFNESKKFKNKEFVEYEDDRFFCSKEEQPDEILLETKKDELLLEALETLPKHLREVFILHFFDGYDKKQIASMLNLNLNTVQKYVINATTHLTKYIEDRDWN